MGRGAVRTASQALGPPPNHGFGLGVLTLVIALPRTAALGSAIAIPRRVGSPVFSPLRVGVSMGVSAWGGPWLRHPVLRALLPRQS